jgi:hypothetical protein
VEIKFDRIRKERIGSTRPKSLELKSKGVNFKIDEIKQIQK